MSMTPFAWITVNGLPETTDLVVLNTPSGPLTLPYLTNYNGMAWYSYSTAVTYQLAGSYSMSVSTSLGTVTSASVSAPGGLTANAAGTAITWTYEGNSDGIVVIQQTGGPVTTYDSYTSIGPDINSPADLSAAYPVATGSTLYNVQTTILNQATFSGTNLAPASRLFVEEGTAGSITK